MNRTRGFIGLVALLGVLLSLSLTASARATVDDFDRALSTMSLSSHDRILAAITAGLEQPGFPADNLLALIERLSLISAPADEKEMILLLFARALEGGLSITGLVPIGFDLADALEEGIPIESVLLEALKGIAQNSPISVIEAGISQRLTLLWSVRDLLFSRGVFRQPAGTAQSVANALPAARFDELVDQIADAVSDYLEGGGGPFDGEAMYALVADRLGKLPASLVTSEDVALVLSVISPADLTQIALAALT
jgi:hypothetical protein